MADLTRKQAIAEHRKMWNWIAEQLEMYTSDDKCEVNIHYLKVEYCKVNGFTKEEKGRPIHYCFCCEYASSLHNCKECPLYWGTENTINGYFCESGMKYSEEISDIGFWSMLYKVNLTYKEAAELSRKIANLPLRIYQNIENGNFHFTYKAMVEEIRELYDSGYDYHSSKWRRWYDVKPLQNSSK